MSAPANETSQSDWAKIAGYVNTVVQFSAPLISAALPQIAVGAKIIAAILDGVVKEIPAAIALYEQIIAGNNPSPEEMKKFFSDYEAAYQKLDADIKEQLAKLPPE